MRAELTRTLVDTDVGGPGFSGQVITRISCCGLPVHVLVVRLEERARTYEANSKSANTGRTCAISEPVQGPWTGGAAGRGGHGAAVPRRSPRSPRRLDAAPAAVGHLRGPRGGPAAQLDRVAGGRVRLGGGGGRHGEAVGRLSHRRADRLCSWSALPARCGARSCQLSVSAAGVAETGRGFGSALGRSKTDQGGGPPSASPTALTRRPARSGPGATSAVRSWDCAASGPRGRSSWSGHHGADPVRASLRESPLAASFALTLYAQGS